MAHAKHEQVRQRYAFRCGYCGITETDTGGELTVDHFRPVSRGGDDSDDNLVYSCFKCNLFKGDFFPSGKDLETGRRIVHPLLDNADPHIRLDEETGRLEPLSETGRFHLAMLQLNRRALVQHRLRVHMSRWLVERQQLLEDEIAMLTTTVTALELHVARLERLAKPPSEE